MYQICCTLDEILQHKPTHWSSRPLIPPSPYFAHHYFVRIYTRTCCPLQPLTYLRVPSMRGRLKIIKLWAKLIFKGLHYQAVVRYISTQYPDRLIWRRRRKKILKPHLRMNSLDIIVTFRLIRPDLLFQNIHLHHCNILRYELQGQHLAIIQG